MNKIARSLIPMALFAAITPAAAQSVENESLPSANPLPDSIPVKVDDAADKEPVDNAAARHQSRLIE